jgi:small subunit ribosomal protein S5
LTQAQGQQGQEGFFGDERAFEEHVVKIYRCAKVVKGGRRFRFGALVIIGDRRGQVGMGYGKANEVPAAVDKGIKYARKALMTVTLRGGTIPHRIEATYGASKVVLVPASEGTGVIAGVHLRPLLELAGIKDVLTKAHGSTNPKNLIQAGLLALRRLRSHEMIAKMRGVELA